MCIRWLAILPIIASPAAAQQTKPDLSFTYTYPAQVSAVAPLKAWFDAEGARLRSASSAQATADRREAAKDGRPFNPYETQRTWKVVADTPRFLSLSETSYDYTGGAHGMTGFAALVWDKAAKRRLQPIALFTSPAALRAAIEPAFCRQLDAERRGKRGGVTGADIPEFAKCIDPVKETVILGSSTRQRFDRIGVLIAPYDAGPYAEGTYEVTLPVTPAVLAAVRIEYRPYFAVAGTP